MLASNIEVDNTIELMGNRFKVFFANLVFKHAHQVICENSFQQNQLTKRKIKTTIIPSFYNISVHNIPYLDRKHHLWIARSEKLKRPELFIEIAKTFPNEKFIMVCMKSTFSTQEYYDSLIEKASEVTNLQFIEFVPVENDAINELYKYAKLFYNTSTYEGLPTTFIQAGKNYIPIISLNVNPDDFLTQYKCGFHCNDSFDELIKMVQLILDSETLWTEASLNSFKYVEENHNLSTNINKLITLINS